MDTPCDHHPTQTIDATCPRCAGSVCPRCREEVGSPERGCPTCVAFTQDVIDKKLDKLARVLTGAVVVYGLFGLYLLVGVALLLLFNADVQAVLAAGGSDAVEVFSALAEDVIGGLLSIGCAVSFGLASRWVKQRRKYTSLRVMLFSGLVLFPFAGLLTLLPAIVIAVWGNDVLRWRLIRPLFHDEASKLRTDAGA